jgi:hypothetical protein
MKLELAKELVKNSGWRRGKGSDGLTSNRIFKFSVVNKLSKPSKINNNVKTY